MKLERRKFLGSTLGMTGATLMPSFVKSMSLTPAESTGFYLMQSGNERNEDIVLWGMLKVYNAPNVAQELETLKFDNNFYSRINYASNNKFKETVSYAFMDYFEANEMILYVKMLNNATVDFADVSPAQRQASKVNFLKELTDGQLQMAKINIKSQSVYGPSVEFKQKFEEQTNVVYYPVRAKADVTMQLCDLLVGSLRAIYLNQVGDNMKLRLNSYLQSKFGLGSYAPGQNYNNKIVFI